MKSHTENTDGDEQPSPAKKPSEHDMPLATSETAHGEDTTNQPKYKTNRENYWLKWTEPQVIVNGLLACVGIVGALIYYGQLVEMKNSVNDARLSTRLDERAWIVFLDADGEIETNITPVRARVHITNAGKTPALDVRIHTYIRFAKPGDEPSFDEDDKVQEQASTAILAPNDPKSAGIIGEKGREYFFSPIQFMQIVAGKLDFYVISKVTYCDIFGRPHWTTFCASWDNGTKDYVAYKEHNKIDPPWPP